MQLGNVRQLAHGAVRLVRVEYQFSPVAFRGGYQARQIADGDFLSGADVDMAVPHLPVFPFQLAEIHLFHHVDAGVRHVFAPQEFAQGRARSPQFHGTGGDAVFGQRVQDGFFRRRPVHLFHRPRVQVFPHGVPVPFHQAFGQVNLAHHGGQHVAVLQVEVVIGAV